jgi:hypothetical protein
MSIMTAKYPKIFGSVLLIVSLIGTSSCMTCCTIDRAKTKTYHTENNGKLVEESHPAYYLLLPFTVPGDVVTSPFQAVWGLVGLAFMGPD